MTTKLPSRFEFGAGLGSLALASTLASPSPARAEGYTLSIIAGNSTPGIFDTLELVAAGAGFYKEANLTVNKDYAAGAGTAAQLVASGKADVASLSVEPVLVGYDKGIKLQFFLSRQARYSYVLAVLDNSPIRTLEDFKGKTLGEVNAGSAAEVTTQSMLAGVGIKPSEYNYIPLGTGAAPLTAITTKKVDGMAFPYLEIAQDTVLGNVTFRVFRHPILKDISNVGYAAYPNVIAAKSEALKRFSRAIVKASILVRVNPAAAARLYLTGSGQHLTDDALSNTTKIFTLLEDDFPAANLANPKICNVSPQGLQLYSQYLAQFGMIKSPVPGTAVATDQFIAYANDFDKKALIASARAMH
jgi:NitT/TauT family transport system substrate-binding protein